MKYVAMDTQYNIQTGVTAAYMKQGACSLRETLRVPLQDALSQQ